MTKDQLRALAATAVASFTGKITVCPPRTYTQRGRVSCGQTIMPRVMRPSIGLSTGNVRAW